MMGLLKNHEKEESEESDGGGQEEEGKGEDMFDKLQEIHKDKSSRFQSEFTEF
jgi:hypothetical protein